jgi:hypothetical protein
VSLPSALPLPFIIFPFSFFPLINSPNGRQHYHFHFWHGSYKTSPPARYWPPLLHKFIKKPKDNTIYCSSPQDPREAIAQEIDEEHCHRLSLL